MICGKFQVCNNGMSFSKKEDTIFIMNKKLNPNIKSKMMIRVCKYLVTVLPNQK